MVYEIFNFLGVAGRGVRQGRKVWEAIQEGVGSAVPAGLGQHIDALGTPGKGQKGEMVESPTHPHTYGGALLTIATRITLSISTLKLNFFRES